MPIKIKDTDGGLGNVIEFQGIVTDQEYLDAMEKHFNQGKAKFSKYRYSVTDAIAVASLDISNNAIESVAELCIKTSEYNPDPIVAFAASTDLAFGLSRMAEMLFHKTNWEIEVFRSRKEAVEWIKERVKDKFGIDGIELS